MERQRAAIIELFEIGNSSCSIMKTLNIEKGRQAFVYRTLNRYKETGEVKDMERSGRPTSITTTRMRKVIRSRIRRNSRKSMRKLSSELVISRSSVSKVAKKDLGLYSYKLRWVHLVSDKIKQKRLVRSKGLIRDLRPGKYSLL